VLFIFSIPGTGTVWKDGETLTSYIQKVSRDNLSHKKPSITPNKLMENLTEHSFILERSKEQRCKYSLSIASLEK